MHQLHINHKSYNLCFNLFRCVQALIPHIECPLVFMSLCQRWFYLSCISSSAKKAKYQAGFIIPAHHHRQKHALVISHQASRLLWHFVSAVRPSRFTVDWIWAPSGQSCPIFPDLTAVTSYDECAFQGKEVQSSRYWCPQLIISDLLPDSCMKRPAWPPSHLLHDIVWTIQIRHIGQLKGLIEQKMESPSDMLLKYRLWTVLRCAAVDSSLL